MTTHTVVQGECLSTIAVRYHRTVRELWTHPANAELKASRRNPNVLHPGDVVTIPDRESHRVNAQSGRAHRFRVELLRPQSHLKVTLRENHQALADEPFEVHVEGRVLRGTTDGDGKIDVVVPVLSGQASLVLTRLRRRYRLRIGHLDPADSITGVQSRLRQMGFYAGPVDGQSSKTFVRALRTFREKHGLSAPAGANEEIDDDLRAALERENGC